MSPIRAAVPIEGENRILKDVNLLLADASQRRGRGFGVHCVVAAIKVAVANIREAEAQRGRPASTTFADYALSDDRPTYIVGQKSPSLVA